MQTSKCTKTQTCQTCQIKLPFTSFSRKLPKQ